MTIKTHVWINNVPFFKIIKVFMFQKFQLWAEIKPLLTFSNQRKGKTHNLYSCQTIQQSNSKDQAVRTRTLTAGLNYRDTPLSQVGILLRTCNDLLHDVAGPDTPGPIGDRTCAGPSQVPLRHMSQVGWRSWPEISWGKAYLRSQPMAELDFDHMTSLKLFIVVAWDFQH